MFSKLLFLVPTIALVSFNVSAQSFIEQDTFTIFDPVRQSGVGGNIAVDGDTAIVGVFNGDAAYIFNREGNSWSETAKLQADDNSSVLDFFGATVDISGTRAVVGALTSLDESGAAYVFDLTGNGWVQSAKLTSNPTPVDSFGTAVSIDGDRIVVSERRADQGSLAVSVFEFDGVRWSETAQIPIPGEEARFEFGSALSLDGDRLLVGSTNENNGTGAAYIYELTNNQWVLTTRLAPPTPLSDNPLLFFGSDVELQGDVAVVSGMGLQFREGEVFVFVREGSSWNLVAELSDDDFIPNQEQTGFGERIAIDGNLIAVGASANDTSLPGAGAVYVYELNGDEVTEIAMLTADNASVGDGFGASVAISDNRLLVGAPRLDGVAEDTGLIYAYQIENDTETPTQTPTNIIAVDDFGSGHIATFKYKVKASDTVNGTLKKWKIDVSYKGPGVTERSWMRNYRGSVESNVRSHGVTLSNTGNRRLPTLRAGDEIVFKVLVRGAGFIEHSFALNFTSLDSRSVASSSYAIAIGADDWYNPTRGGGFIATFECAFDQSDLSSALIDISYNGKGVVARGWMLDYIGPITSGVNGNGYFIRSDAVVSRDNAQFQLLVRGAGYNESDFNIRCM